MFSQGGFRTIAAAVFLAVPALAAAQLPSGFQTPGATVKADAAKVCTADFVAAAKPVSSWQRDQALTRYGRRPEDFTGDLDHLIPLALGGSNDPDNLWPMPATGEFGAEKKHELETRLHDLVCGEKKLTLKQAQDAIRKDWIKAYTQYVQGQNAAK